MELEDSDSDEDLYIGEDVESELDFNKEVQREYEAELEDQLDEVLDDRGYTNDAEDKDD